MHLYRRWIVANSIAELLGLGLVGFVGAQSIPLLGEARWLVAAVAVALGACEGLLVGAFQWWAVHPSLPRLRAREWIAATVLGAVVAWALGVLPSTLMHQSNSTAPPSPPAWLRYAAASALGIVTGPILAAFQWRVLRRHVAGAGWWMLANAAAWAVGMPVVFLAVAASIHGEPLFGLALVAACGASVGAIHGAFLARLVHAHDAPPPEHASSSAR